MTESSFDIETVPPVELHATRPFYWSVRREIWENRSLYIAPLVVAAFVLLVCLPAAFALPRRLRTIDPAKHTALMTKPYSFAPAPIMLVSFLVGLFYSIDALYGERRDRSILFWKSLPVSDVTTVLAKASIPIIVLPLIALVLSVAAICMLLLQGTTVLTLTGTNPMTLWSRLRFFERPLFMLYGLVVHALWFTPIYAWLLLISAWAKRSPLLWAVLPPVLICVLEKTTFNTTYFGAFIRYRITGAMDNAFVVLKPGPVSHISSWDILPLRFLSTPGLWGGLIFAALCLAATVRLRRNREPI